MTQEQLEEYCELKYKAGQADSLAWKIGYIKTLMELGIDPTPIVETAYDRYKNDDKLSTMLQHGVDFAIKSNKDGQYEYSDRIRTIHYDKNTD